MVGRGSNTISQFKNSKLDIGWIPRMATNLVNQGISTVESEDIIISNFRFPLKYLVKYLRDVGKESTPNIHPLGGPN